MFDSGLFEKIWARTRTWMKKLKRDKKTTSTRRSSAPSDPAGAEFITGSNSSVGQPPPDKKGKGEIQMSNPATPGSPATPAPGGGAGSSTTPSGSSAAPTTASGGAGTATPPRGAARAGISARASVGGVGVPIRFLDMKERNDAERDRLKARQFELLSLASQLSAQGSGSSLRAAATNPATPVLPPDLQQELADI